MNRERGLGLVELMGVISLFSVVCVILMGMERAVYRHDRAMDGYVTDLAQCRRALHHLEADLRAASGVRAAGTGYRLQIGDSVVAYNLTDGVLERTAAGRRTTAARRIAAVEIQSRGGYVDLTVKLQRRSAPAHVPLASVHTSVFLRGGER